MQQSDLAAVVSHKSNETPLLSKHLAGSAQEHWASQVLARKKKRKHETETGSEEKRGNMGRSDE